MLQGMLDRKKGSNEILQQRAVAFQSASTPAALVAPTPALAAPTPTPLAAPTAEHFQLFEDAESGQEASEDEQSDGEPNTFQPTASGTSAGSALASGASAVGSALASGGLQLASSGIDYATTGSKILLDAGIHAAIGAGNALGSVGQTARQTIAHRAMIARPYIASGVGAVGSGIGHGIVSVGQGLGHGVVSVGQGLGHGVGALAHGGAHVTTQHILPGVASLASAAYEHGVPVAHAALTGLSYKGSDLFHALLEGIKSLPAIPSLEMPRTAHVGDTLATSYAPIRKKQRSSSPSTAAASFPAQAHATPFIPVSNANSPNVHSYDTADQWRAFSTGKGALGQQLMLRPAFVQAERAQAVRGEGPISQNGSRGSTATKLKGLTPDDMIQLLLFLDGKH